MIDDIRKLIQDLVTPDLKAIRVELASNREVAKLQTEVLDLKLSDQIAGVDAKFTAKCDLILARMDAQHAMVMNSLELNKRVEHLERQIKPAEPAAA